MAPKKTRIKEEQELQGESGGSGPHRATQPSNPGAEASRRQRQKKLRRVWWPVKKKKLHKGTEPCLYTPFAPFVRLVKEITESCPSQVKRWTPEALLWLQDGQFRKSALRKLKESLVKRV